MAKTPFHDPELTYSGCELGLWGETELWGEGEGVRLQGHQGAGTGSLSLCLPSLCSLPHSLVMAPLRRRLLAFQMCGLFV